MKVRDLVDKLDPTKVQCCDCGEYLNKSEAIDISAYEAPFSRNSIWACSDCAKGDIIQNNERKNKRSDG